MNNGQLEISLSLTNEKVQFVGVSQTNSNNPVTFDYLPPIGDGKGYRGLDLLILSFGGCVSTAIVCILRKMGKSISGYKMNLKGVKREQPLSLEKICFEIVLESQDLEDSDVQKAITVAEQISPVWLAIKNNVEIISEYRIITE